MTNSFSSTKSYCPISPYMNFKKSTWKRMWSAENVLRQILALSEFDKSRPGSSKQENMKIWYFHTGKTSSIATWVMCQSCSIYRLQPSACLSSLQKSAYHSQRSHPHIFGKELRIQIRWQSWDPAVTSPAHRNLHQPPRVLNYYLSPLHLTSNWVTL